MAKKKKWTPPKATTWDEFKGFKLRARLVKKRSPLVIDFLQEEGEDWFIEKVTYRKKSRKITHDSMITEKDFEDSLERLQRLCGYEIEIKND
jgi:hypothetical protein